MLKLNKVLVAAFCVFALLLVATPAAFADDWDKATRVTVNQPFEIPGMVLPAGTYIVKIMDLAGDRHVVRFLSEDELTVYATIIGIPSFRLEPAEKPTFTFYEAEVNRPQPLHEWFYSGNRYGIEFVYPKAEAAEIATVIEEPVIPFEEPVVEVLPLEEPVVATTPVGEETELAAVVYPEFPTVIEPELEGDYASPLPELPRTATPFPLLALAGLFAAGTATALRFFRR